MQVTARLALVSSVFGIVLFASGGTAFAQSTDDKAREFHKQGVALFNEGNFVEAAAAFRKAYDLKPAWKLLYNIGQSEAAAKRYGLAMDSFEAYLISGGDDVPEDRREYVIGELRRLQPLVGVIEVPGMPNGSVLLIDDEKIAVGPLRGPIRVAAGIHRVAVLQDGKPLREETIQVGGGLSITLNLQQGTSKEQPAVVPSVAPQPEPAPETLSSQELKSQEESLKTHSWKWPVGWAGVGVGLAAGVTGVVTGVVGLSKKEEFDSLCPGSACANEQDKKKADNLKGSMDSLALVTDILIPTGAVLLVAGSMLLILDSREIEKHEKAKLGFLPVATGSSGAIVFQGRF